VVKKKLVGKLVSDGARLLHELDSHDFPVYAMFWVHLVEEDYWRLVIASTLVEKEGGTASYKRLNLRLSANSDMAITLSDITLVEPDSPAFRSMRALITTSARLAPGPEWLEFEDAVVYRWNDASATADLTCDQALSSNDLAKLWEEERAAGNDPAFLFSVTGRRLTLRFHPQHGDSNDPALIRKAFELALKRKYPNCRLNWR
jgi:hypothetical protein